MFFVGGVDHLDVDLGAFEGRVFVDGFDVVEEVAGEGGVGVDGGGLEAEVGVVLGDFFVDGVVVDGDGDDGDLGALGALEGEDAAVDLFEVAAGILSLLAEMNCMRASSRERAVSPSLVMMTRTGMRPWGT